MSIERSRRRVVRTATAGVLLVLSACAQSPTEPQGDTAARVDIRAEDVEQVDIQEVSARQRAAQELCRQAGRCGSGNEGVNVDLIFGPYPD